MGIFNNTDKKKPTGITCDMCAREAQRLQFIVDTWYCSECVLERMQKAIPMPYDDKDTEKIEVDRSTSSYLS